MRGNPFALKEYLDGSRGQPRVDLGAGEAMGDTVSSADKPSRIRAFTSPRWPPEHNPPAIRSSQQQRFSLTIQCGCRRCITDKCRTPHVDRCDIASGSFEFQKMITPRVEIDEQSLGAELIAVADVACPGQRLDEAPSPAAQIVPRQLHHRLRTVVGEIHHRQRPLGAQSPTPGDDVVKARIVGPAVTLAQMPFAVVEQSA